MSLSRQKVHSLISKGADALTESPHPERARQDAGALLLHLLGKNKAWLIAHAEESLPGDQAARYVELLERRYRGEPIQYITGETEFYGLPFRVTPDVLIPRPETEHLVEKALELAASLATPRIVDVGCGSGAIAVVLAHELCQRSAKRLKAMKGTGFSSASLGTRPTQVDKNATAASAPEGPEENSPGPGSPRTGLRSRGGGQAKRSPGKGQQKIESPVGATEISLQILKGIGSVFDCAVDAAKSTGALAPEECFSENLPSIITAIDLSDAALTIALENAQRNGVSIRFLQGDLLSPVAGEQFEMVVSNPPYVPTADRPTLAVEVREYEPALALFAGGDGLAVYRRLIPAAFAALIPGGNLLMEIGYGQSPAVGELLTSSGFEQIEFVPDLQGISRVACARRPV
jgi:release factor glutamine methyltransferase